MAVAEHGLGIPAVVVSGRGPGTLGVVRSLGRAGVPLILIDDDSQAPAMHSRYGQKVMVSEARGEPLVKCLLTLAARIAGPAVLILNSDDAVLTVSQHREALAQHFLFRLPPHACLTSLMHKTEFHQLAEAHGFPVPRSITVRNITDLRRLVELRFPCIVKPTRWTPEYVKSRLARGYKVSSRREAEDVCSPILAAVPSLVIQEWIEGPHTELYFCLQYRGAEGTIVSSFTGRKLSIWPPDVGTTASCTAAPDEHPRLHALTDAIFRGVSFVGMGSIEFKRDLRTGEFLVIEPTAGRVNAQEEVATLHGANIPLAAYCYELGASVSPVPNYAAPIIWRDFFPHWKSVRAGGSRLTARPTIKICDAYWRRDDPLPALVKFVNGLTSGRRRTVSRGHAADIQP